MSPIVTLLLLVVGWGCFLVSAWRRLRLLGRGGIPLLDPNTYRTRLRRVVTDGFFQHRLHNYRISGLAHHLIFAGFLVLLLRTLVLWGRGFSADFNLIVFDPRHPIFAIVGAGYGCLKDLAVVGVLVGVAIQVGLRALGQQRRLSNSLEAWLILLVIATMMVADVLYDAASVALVSPAAEQCVGASALDWCEGASRLVAPLGSEHARLGEPLGWFFALLLSGQSPSTLVWLGQAGYYAHVVLVLAFLNVLPYSKHQHIITALANLFFDEPDPRPRAPQIARSSEELLGLVDAAMEGDCPETAPIGLATVEHLSFVDRLGLYSCTECGRCSDNCPAHLTGKVLSPKQLVLNLRDHLYQSAPPLLPRAKTTSEVGAPAPLSTPLVPAVIHPDVLWSCTTCGACESECPVAIRPMKNIVGMRRALVMMRGEIPARLAKVCDSLESNGNPWNLPRIDRTRWADGLEVRTLSSIDKTDVLLWVGCAASYDERARRVVRALVRILQLARVDFAILGDEESCTGDVARAMGNEYLFLKLAEENIRLLEGYRSRGRFQRIVTACPHCLCTLKNEYPQFGGAFEVLHHTELLSQLLSSGSLPTPKVTEGRLVYHDPCTLARYTGQTTAPRQVLDQVGMTERIEPVHYGKRTLCCGAGGGRMWDEEGGTERVATRRTQELMEARPDAVAVACPFCLTQLSDALTASPETSETRVGDVAEWMATSLGLTID